MAQCRTEAHASAVFPAYLRRLHGVAVVLAGAVLALNLVVDPLDVFRIVPTLAGFNDSKQDRTTFDRVVKPVDIWRLKPRTLVLGSSIAKQSFDPALLDQSVFSPAYNAAIDNGANLSEHRKYLERYLQSDLSLKTVKIELFLKALLNSRDAPIYPRHTWWNAVFDLPQLGFSRVALELSARTILHSRAGRPARSTAVSRGFAPVQRPTGEISIGLTPNLIFVDKGLTRKGRFSEIQLDEAKKIMQLCRRYSVDCSFYFAPQHALVMYAIHYLGLWNEAENIKRDFAQIGPVRDFARFSAMTDDPGTEGLWSESFHYSAKLGSIVTNVLFGLTPSEAPANFGVTLTSENIESELTEWASERDSWISKQYFVEQRFRSAERNNRGGRSGSWREQSDTVELDGRPYKLSGSRRGGSVDYAEFTKGNSYAFGWIGDPTQEIAAEGVAFFDRGTFVTFIEPIYPRPDLSSDLSSPLRIGGFFATLPFSARALRAIAIYKDGVAAELSYSEHAPKFGVEQGSSAMVRAP